MIINLQAKLVREILSIINRRKKYIENVIVYNALNYDNVEINTKYKGLYMKYKSYIAS